MNLIVIKILCLPFAEDEDVVKLGFGSYKEAPLEIPYFSYLLWFSIFQHAVYFMHMSGINLYIFHNNLYLCFVAGQPYCTKMFSYSLAILS